MSDTAIKPPLKALYEPAPAVIIYQGYDFQIVRIMLNGRAYLCNSKGGIVFDLQEVQ